MTFIFWVTLIPLQFTHLLARALSSALCTFFGTEEGWISTYKSAPTLHTLLLAEGPSVVN